MKLPPKSILTNTKAIVSACEWEEVSLNSSCEPKKTDGGTTTTTTNTSQPLKYVLVTELAALLHLGSYTHARHLWHRHRSTIHTLTSPKEGEEEKNETDTITIDDPEYDQFQRLWKAAQPLLLASASPSIRPPLSHPSLESTTTHSNTTTTTAQSSSPSKQTNPTTTPTLDPIIQQPLDLQSSRKQFYSQLRSMSNNTSTTTPPTCLEPLATYANELILSQRMHMVRLLEENYDTIPKDDDADSVATTTTHKNSRLLDLLGYENSTDLEEFLKRRDWILDGDGLFWIPGEMYLREELVGRRDGSLMPLIPPTKTVYDPDQTGFGLLDIGTTNDGVKEEEEDGRTESSSLFRKDDKIRFLTNLVGFMERQGLDGIVSREVKK